MPISAQQLVMTASKAHPSPSRSRPHDVDEIFPETPRRCILSLPLPADPYTWGKHECPEPSIYSSLFPMIECASLLLLVCRFVAGHPHLPGRPAGERLHLLTLSLSTHARSRTLPKPVRLIMKNSRPGNEMVRSRSGQELRTTNRRA